ncbi:hypothetical protein VTJ83DRAFT_6950 [Remersonia thermophila]|uniref:Heterokaryon incompatibility domain-containing protein n=1 Tax=Remersonia thermophila TaxID=72144 RepID=A0ABR4D6A2_9PEZI
MRGSVEGLVVQFNVGVRNRGLEVRLLLNTPGKWAKSVTLSFYAERVAPKTLRSLLPDLPVGLPIPPSTGSNESLAWALQQLSSCRRHHKACNDPSLSTTSLPTRLLDVSVLGCVRLHTPGPDDPVEPYAALSHCWGRKPFLQTTSGTLQEHCAPTGVSWARLPPTFRDAADLTRRLGIKYLWIDSLCIVQDDHDDWNREASRMADVYRGAAVTISAAKSPGAYGGLFAEVGQRGKVYAVEVGRGDAGDTPPAGTEDGPSVAQGLDAVHVRVSFDHPDTILSPHNAPAPTLPTFSRGWILQERLLSPHILHFGPQELLFECLESSVCQCTPQPEQSDTENDKGVSLPSPNASAATAAITTCAPAQTPPTWQSLFFDCMTRHKHYYALTTWKSWLSLLPRSSQDGELTALGALATAWRRLIHDYTRLSLTMERDIFPAVSGMARTMAAVRWRATANAAAAGEDDNGNIVRDINVKDGPDHDAYCAGMWRATLLTGDLLWHVDLPVGGRPEPGADGDEKDNKENVSHSHGRWEGGWPCRPRHGWRAPSWSWASVAAPVEFLVQNEGLNGGGVQVQAELLDVACEPTGEDPMGELRAGGSVLVLKGRLIPTRLTLKERKSGKDEEAGLKPWDVIDLDVVRKGYVKNVWVDDDCGWLVGSHSQRDGQEGEPIVYLLVLGQRLPGRSVLCLILTEVASEQRAAAWTGSTTVDDGLYQRIGLLEVIGGPPRPVPGGWFLELMEKGKDAVVKIV